MPSSCILFLFLKEITELSGVFVEFFVEFAVDGADLGVYDAVAFTFRVEDGVDVEARGGGFARGEAEALDELLLEVGCQVVLGAEEDYAALGDWLVLVKLRRKWREGACTGEREFSEQLL
jgi:hypothetical protein